MSEMDIGRRQWGHYQSWLDFDSDLLLLIDFVNDEEASSTIFYGDLEI